MTQSKLTPTPAMSSRRQLILTAIRQYYRENGRSPSYQELGARVGLEPRHIRPHLEQLERDGLITFRRGVGRSIEMVDRTANLSDEEIEAAAHARGWQIVRSALPALVQSIGLPSEPMDMAALLGRIDDVTHPS